MDPLRQLAARHGPRRALSDRGAGFWVTWFDLDQLAHTWAGRFEAAALRTGERVAVQEPAGVRFSALLHACLRFGAALVPIPPQAPAAEVERILADSRPRFFVREGQLEPTGLAAAAGDPEDVCVLYTSGTSGQPKGVRLTLANHAASAEGCVSALAAGPEDRWLQVLSPHHAGGMAILFRSVFFNQPVVALPEFDLPLVLEAIESERPTLAALVPTMLTKLLQAGGLDGLRRLRAILIGGAPAPADEVRAWADLGLNVCPSYGLTESASQVAVVPPGRAKELAGTAGLVGAHARIDLEAGQIIISGACLSPGYVNAELKPSPADGRFATGDLGLLQDGVLTVLGRSDDTIITGGESVNPEEVEAVLRAHPGVREVAVAGRPDPLWGRVVGAWLVSEAEVQELEDWCRARLPPFKVPRLWHRVSELPRNSGGKVVRRSLPD
ncbi:MAG: acyl--CoA ligase [Candidatus Dormibacteraeota bacterium]|nr:acyl--CoA ligase [Candidatus Dormibacteraeota bacterium]